MKNLITILSWATFLTFDLFVFLLLGLLLMEYDENFDLSKGDYGSFNGMNTRQKFIYLAYNGWIILNLIGLGYLGIKLFRRLKLLNRKTI